MDRRSHKTNTASRLINQIESQDSNKHRAVEPKADKPTIQDKVQSPESKLDAHHEESAAPEAGPDMHHHSRTCRNQKTKDD